MQYGKAVIRALAVVGGAVIISNAAYATDYTWTAPAGGEWRDNSNWTPNTGFPGSGSGDSARFVGPPAGGTVNLQGQITLQNLTGTTSRALTITGGPTFGAAGLTVTGLAQQVFDEIELTSTGGAFDSSLVLPGTTYTNNRNVRLLAGTGGARRLENSWIVNEGAIVVSGDGFIGRVGDGSFQNGTSGLGAVSVTPTGQLRANGYVQQGNASTFLNGSLDVLSGPIEINGGQVRGDGVMLDPITVRAARLEPVGFIPGTTGTLRAAGDVTLGDGAQLRIRLGGPGDASRLAVTGDLLLTGQNTFLSLDGGVFGETYTIATFTGTRTDTFDAVTPNYVIDYNVAGEVRVLVLPEPLATGAGLMLLPLSARRPRRREAAHSNTGSN